MLATSLRIMCLLPFKMHMCSVSALRRHKLNAQHPLMPEADRQIIFRFISQQPTRRAKACPLPFHTLIDLQLFLFFNLFSH